jgi:hypothetical protein
LTQIFNGLCPSLIKPAEKCEDLKCSESHSLPTVLQVQQQLEKGTKLDTENVYRFLLTFPQKLRIKFIPAFANVFIKCQQMDMVKQLALDCKKLKIDTSFIVAAMTQNGWNLLSAAKFVISALDSTEKKAPDN